MKSESKIQQEIVMWYRNNYCTTKNEPRNLIFSVPNEGKDINEQMAKKATGLLSGVSDLIVVMNNKVIFVEVKDEKGKQKPKQKIFERDVSVLGHLYYVVRSLNDFKNIIELWS